MSRTVYDALGRATHTTDQFLLRDNGDGTETVVSSQITGSKTIYDSLGRVTQTVRLVDLAVALVEDDADGIPASEVTAPGTVVSTSQTHYDDQGRTGYTVDQYQNESHTVYDVAGRVIETRRHTRDQDGTLLWSVSRTVYDAAGRAVYSTDPFLMTTDATPAMVSATVSGAAPEARGM